MQEILLIDHQTIASIGVFILLLAFVLNLTKVLSNDSRAYALLNFVGAAIAAYASWLIAFYPFVVLEGVWAAVSLGSLIRGLLSRQTQST